MDKANAEYIAMHLDRLSEELLYDTYGKRIDELEKIMKNNNKLKENKD